MKKSTGILMLAAFSLLVTVTALHGCGSNNEPSAPVQAKFTIVGAGS
jgi:hypothetical protein